MRHYVKEVVPFLHSQHQPLRQETVLVSSYNFLQFALAALENFMGNSNIVRTGFAAVKNWAKLSRINDSYKSNKSFYLSF